jgi:hypothetical protein
MVEGLVDGAAFDMISIAAPPITRALGGPVGCYDILNTRYGIESALLTTERSGVFCLSVGCAKSVAVDWEINLS